MTPAPEIVDLIRAGAAFVAELKRFGYGETSDLPLPGTYDPFVLALETARERLMEQESK
jgi:hypothetical protein